MPAPKVRQRVTLLYRGVKLGVELLALLGEERAVNVISTPLELAKDGPPADVVVVDVPAEDRRTVCEEVRRHYRGPLIVLLDQRDNSHHLPPDRSRTLLTRPFSMRELAVALAASASPPPVPEVAAGLRLLLPHGAQNRKTGPGPNTGRSTIGQAVPRLMRSWRERRLVRMSIIAIMAALLFMGAFALVNQSDPCGPGCDELTGADLTSPSSTTVGAVGAVPYTADPGVGVVGPTTTETSANPAADEGSGIVVATDSPARISTSTASSSGAPPPTSSKDPSPPPPSAPSTMAPTTSRPRPPTTTATTTPTTTTTTTTTTEP
jgi:hypothetical protein